MSKAGFLPNITQNSGDEESRVDVYRQRSVRNIGKSRSMYFVLN